MRQGLSHEGCLRLCRRVIMHLQFHSTGFMCPLYVYTLAPARYKATRDIFQVTGRPQHESQPFHLGMPLHAGALHACFAVLRFLDVNKFPMTWWRLVSQYHPFQIIRWSHHPTFPRCAAVLAPGGHQEMMQKVCGYSVSNLREDMQACGVL